MHASEIRSVRPEHVEGLSSTSGKGEGKGFDKLSPNGLRGMIVAGALLAAGCTPVDHGFGETTRWNIEQQVVDPDPQYAGDVMEGGSGERGADAADRYNRGEVIQPVSTGTSGGASGSGSSSSSSGGPQ